MRDVMRGLAFTRGAPTGAEAGSAAVRAAADPLSTAGRRSVAELRIVGTLALVALVLVGSVVRVGVERPSIADRQRLDAADAALADVQTADERLLLLFYQWLSVPDPMGAEGSTVGAAVTTANSEARAAWARYRRVAVPSARERNLVAAYEGSVEAGEEYATGLFDNPHAFATDPESLRWRMENLSGGLGASVHRLDLLRDMRALYAAQRRDVLSTDDERLRRSLDVAFSVVVVLAVVVTAVGAALTRRSRRRAAALQVMQDKLHEHGRMTRIEAQLNRALEMADNEGEAYNVLRRALREAVGEQPAELLMADSSLAHLHRVVRSGVADGGCGVAAARSCPAARRGHTQRFGDSEALDACPHLPADASACGSICTPMAVGGVTTGVLRIATNDLDDVDVAIAELIVRKAGERIGVLRAFARSENQARTDPLTGLLNRRSLEQQAQSAVGSGRRYAVAFADLDHFKLLNDIYGHDVGDRALRLFAQSLRDAMRPTDIVARYGGEEFVVVLPDCDTDGLRAVLNRVNELLATALDGGTVPKFTASYGITDSDSDDLLSVIARADQALLAAKRGGRNRTVVWAPDLEPPQTPREPEEPTAAVVGGAVVGG